MEGGEGGEGFLSSASRNWHRDRPGHGTHASKRAEVSGPAHRWRGSCRSPGDQPHQKKRVPRKGPLLTKGRSVYFFFALALLAFLLLEAAFFVAIPGFTTFHALRDLTVALPWRLAGQADENQIRVAKRRNRGRPIPRLLSGPICRSRIPSDDSNIGSMQIKCQEFYYAAVDFFVKRRTIKKTLFKRRGFTSSFRVPLLDRFLSSFRRCAASETAAISGALY
jgi:hypothetical protein